VNRKGLYFLALIVFLLAIPLFVRDPYRLHILIITMLHIILALGLNFVMNTAQVPLCQSAFMGIGAYTSTLLVMRLGFSFWFSLPLAGMFTTILAIMIGLPTLRIKGIYFAMATFAFGEIVRLIFIGWVGLFGGANGISSIPPPNSINIPYIWKIEFQDKVPYYYLTLIFLLFCFNVISRLTRSRIGRAFTAIHESDILAESTGIDTMRYKVFAFALNSFFAGIVGGIYAHYFHFIGPQDFTFWQSVEYIVFVIVGGQGTIGGPILGSIFLTFLPEFLRIAVEFQVVIYGMALILVILFLPRGIIDILDRFILRKIFA
jgi:branched-chain amino acid transport system permease protein